MYSAGIKVVDVVSFVVDGIFSLFAGSMPFFAITRELTPLS
jgi:hypothetical protein